jgi:hypothetical protein
LFVLFRQGSKNVGYKYNRVAGPDLLYFGKLNPDPDQHWREKLDPDPHYRQNSEALEAHNRAVGAQNRGLKAQNGDLEDLQARSRKVLSLC